MNSRFDVFELGGVPVAATGGYLLLLAWYVFGGHDVEGGLIFAVAATSSILLHEYGHASVASWFDLRPRIVLHAWGGLCQHEHASTPRDEALVIAAGPGAGLVFGGVLYALSAAVLVADPDFFHKGPIVQRLVDDLLYVNIGWSLVNLLPLWPLDGGQLFRIGAFRAADPAIAGRVVHVVGLVMGAGLAAVAWMVWGSAFSAILAALLALQNWNALQAWTEPAVSR